MVGGLRGFVGVSELFLINEAAGDPGRLYRHPQEPRAFFSGFWALGWVGGVRS